jgi:hypothetical protein
LRGLALRAPGKQKSPWVLQVAVILLFFTADYLMRLLPLGRAGLQQA